MKVSIEIECSLFLPAHITPPSPVLPGASSYTIFVFLFECLLHLAADLTLYSSFFSSSSFHVFHFLSLSHSSKGEGKRINSDIYWTYPNHCWKGAGVWFTKRILKNLPIDLLNICDVYCSTTNRLHSSIELLVRYSLEYSGGSLLFVLRYSFVPEKRGTKMLFSLLLFFSSSLLLSSYLIFSSCFGGVPGLGFDLLGFIGERRSQTSLTFCHVCTPTYAMYPTLTLSFLLTVTSLTPRAWINIYAWLV